jgi:methyltransferase (TIGR00027 family)
MTGDGSAESVLPLCAATSNQHATHQGALISLASDYTAGIALGTVLRGIPIIGFHRLRTPNGAAIWLVRMRVDYKMPSTEDLVVAAAISPESADRIRALYASGAQVIEDVHVSCVAGGSLVATATMTFAVRQSKFLRPTQPNERLGTLFNHKAKATARMIAGVRELAARGGLIAADPSYAEAAGAHGKLLAQRVTSVLPQLPRMIAARTQSVDGVLRMAADNGVCQLALVGAGLDFRCLRAAQHGLYSRTRPLKCYELDLPPMLEERARVQARLSGISTLQQIPLALNLELQDPAAVLLDGGFDPAAAAVIVIEGVSMYLERDVNSRILSSLASLVSHRQSCIWLDAVAQSAIDRTKAIPEVDAFLETMERLGEPFIFGVDDARAFFKACGLKVLSTVSSASRGSESMHPIFGLYHFHQLRAA